MSLLHWRRVLPPPEPVPVPVVPVTAGWPDPHGPDRTVFGPWPKAIATDADYGVTPC